MCGVLSEGPLSITVLARELGTSVSAATQLADRLEAGGLVTRVAEIEDRRVKHLMLTPLGDTLMRRRQERRVQQAAEVLAHLGAARREEVLAVLSRGSMKPAARSRRKRTAKRKRPPRSSDY